VDDIFTFWMAISGLNQEHHEKGIAS